MANTVERFSNRVANYVKFRPGYPKEVLQFLTDEINLQTSSVVADIGSGTGISAKLFLENGNPVFGVEPNAAMRLAAEEFLKDFPNFKSVEGTAENTNLNDTSVDFVVAAQAFHWFDKAKTRAEFRRILRDKGFVILIWNERQLDSTEFLREYEQLLLEYGTDYNQVRHENITAEILGEFFQAEFRQKVFQNHQVLDFEGLKGRMLSSSYIPSEDNPRFAEMIKTLESVFTKHQKNDTIQISYDTNVYYGQI
jgi:ubiquinone/menaquinone biosynthesis C-methylase UbiE